MRVASRLAALACVVLAACPTPKEPEQVRAPPPATPAPDLAAVPDPTGVLAAYCEWSIRCGRDESGTADVDLCMRRLFAAQEGYAPSTFGGHRALADSVVSGQVTIDAAKARTCAEEFALLGCSETGLPKSCSEITTGTVTKGGRCIVQEACGPGLFCLPSSTSVCDGSCVPSEGRCLSNEPCPADRHHCDLTTFTCVSPEFPPGADGKPCGLVDEPCQPGLGCFEGGEQGVCRPLGKDGETCAGSGDAWDGLCADGFICKFEQTGPVCRPRTPPRPEGAACSPMGAGDGLMNECAEGLTCVMTKLGDPLHGVCMPRRAKGEPCTELLQCGGLTDRLICDLSAGRCIDRPKTGPCIGDPRFGCDPLTAYCDIGTKPPTCRLHHKPGESCDLMTQSECGAAALGGGLCMERSETDPTTVCKLPEQEQCRP